MTLPEATRPATAQPATIQPAAPKRKSPEPEIPDVISQWQEEVNNFNFDFYVAEPEPAEPSPKRQRLDVDAPAHEAEEQVAPLQEAPIPTTMDQIQALIDEDPNLIIPDAPPLGEHYAMTQEEIFNPTGPQVEVAQDIDWVGLYLESELDRGVANFAPRIQDVICDWVDIYNSNQGDIVYRLSYALIPHGMHINTRLALLRWVLVYDGPFCQLVKDLRPHGNSSTGMIINHFLAGVEISAEEFDKLTEVFLYEKTVETFVNGEANLLQ
ncbi:uncharacterized protein F4822DRAFT_384303 [Hypoxylon trugodes]|uniref:uncharacterized protein n=1 Tax=Hypoxylon trugodes TaxID=326681 RepID=UPI00218FE58F|nr:uncharacterized protein F4822DRAFT_384303 [Hypoxylon trugodes]KAI1393321.1 hypothetical protein F4822DRAFT_384303 [Hypoxylon trugodes]